MYLIDINFIVIYLSSEVTINCPVPGSDIQHCLSPAHSSFIIWLSHWQFEQTNIFMPSVCRTSNNRSVFSWHNFLYCMLYFCIFRLFCFSFPWSLPLLKFFWMSYFFCVDSEVWCRVKLNCKSKSTYFVPFPNSFSFLWLCYN